MVTLMDEGEQRFSAHPANPHQQLATVAPVPLTPLTPV